MPNSWFQFKKFRVDQAHSGMKVTTEGCILGGIAATLDILPNRILDIGTGTGVLALMLAQKFSNAMIDAVELDEKSAKEASKNFSNSPWSDCIKLHHLPIQKLPTTQSYDLIISNPPFFQNSLQTEQAHLNYARHNDTLSQHDLARVVDNALSTSGVFVLLYPQREMLRFIELSTQYGLHINRSINIYNHDQSPIFRQIGVFSKKISEVHKERLDIRKSSDNQYSELFVNLLKDYYLHL